MFAGLQPGFGRSNRVLDRSAAGVPNLGLAPSLTFATETVIRPEPDELCGFLNPRAAKLCSQIRKVNVARLLVGDIDADVAAGFAGAVVVRDGSTASFG